VTISASGQKVYVNSVKALGSTAASGASNLILDICYKETAGSITHFGATLSYLRVPQNTTVPMGLNAIITGLGTGTYDVGLCGYSSDASNWDANDYGYTSAFVFVTP
jgi:hypothetical protein